MALTPVDLIQDHLPVDRRFISALSKRKQVIVRY
jgi:hypothetical protein